MLRYHSVLISSVLASLAALAICSCSQTSTQTTSGVSAAQAEAYRREVESEKAVALALVQKRPDAGKAVSEYPQGVWEVDSEREEALSVDDGDRIYCPHEYDVWYGQQSDPDFAHTWQWHVNVAVRMVSNAHHERFAHLASFSPPPTPFSIEDGERVHSCYDGKPPAVADPDFDPSP